MFTLLQAARFVAAFLVLCRHGELVFGLPKYFDFHPLGGALNGGNLGVDFFFVLSGFIICYAHWDDIGRPDRLIAYVRSRATRIYPAYWIIFLLLLVPFYFIPSRFETLVWSPDYLLRQFLLLPSADGFVEVNWTLQHEVAFYLVFALLIADRMLGLVGLALWFLASGSITGAAAPTVDVLADPRHSQFLFGMAAAFVIRHHAVPSPSALLAVGLAGFVACLYAGGLGYGDLALPGAPNITLAAGLASALIVAALVELERSHAWRAPAVLRRLGDASYAIYLIHLPVLTFAVRIIAARHLETMVPLPILFVATLSVALGAGVAFHVAIERPLLARLRSPHRRNRSDDPAAARQPLVSRMPEHG